MKLTLKSGHHQSLQRTEIFSFNIHNKINTGRNWEAWTTTKTNKKGPTLLARPSIDNDRILTIP